MKRFKKTLRWTGIIIGGLVGIGLIANAIFVWTTDTRLERQLAAIRAAGDPLTLAEFARPPIPAEKNAATYLRRAEADVAAIAGIELSGYADFLMPPGDQKIFKAALAAHPNVIPLLEQAAACPGLYADMDCTLPAAVIIGKMLPDINLLRADVRVLKDRARLLAAEGNCDEAARTSLLLFRLAQHCEQFGPPMGVNYLVAMAIRGDAVDTANVSLQAGPVSKKTRNALDAELAIQDRLEGFAPALKSERVVSLDYFGCESPFRNLWLVNRGVWNRRKSEYLDKMNVLLNLLREPVSYQQAERILGETDFLARAFRGGQEEFERPFFGAMGMFHGVTLQRARIRSLRVLNALQTHVPAGINDVPKLTDLGLPAEAITDPYTGEPLHVKRTPQGWLVYSVGPNFRDDGGKLGDPGDPDAGDVGVGPPPLVAKRDKKD
ncbi:MAG: hypothetical protein ABSG53_09780 [Thermoguttaceae bacterium]|jgi:hypothetical protein